MKILDADIRTSLYNRISNEFKDEQDTIIVDELSVCQGDARMDVAVVNGLLHGYEIKSEGDTLKRLPNQIEIYNKVFDTVTIVTSDSHLNKTIDIIPEWWGVIKVRKYTKSFYLEDVREPKLNDFTDAYSIVQLLWRNEALQILKDLGLQKGFLSKPRYVLWERLVECIELNDLKKYVRQALKTRTSWRVGQLQKICDD
ncbi:sce7726 family protein [Paramaledivibacter caminithermalis]|uniref:Sce7726 family protein n=1 Tax=Paramaledivibacter caminithermalis (strain DSM 15212 / CIP 107654 / DViRD3) TaxID=1121301 RepID=A0A1M6TYV2_PARC5|nr:sce7726 family protein [Paramaledivibacter caminithermalis]SHK62063.1 hypothetical protein SAMN02745912_03830 [Paramaledivibacter caminithermalis DSM 15212]